MSPDVFNSKRSVPKRTMQRHFLRLLIGLNLAALLIVFLFLYTMKRAALLADIDVALIVSLLFLGINLVLSILISREMARPLEQLTATIQAVVEGNVALDAAEEGYFEVMTLACHFNRLHRILREKIVTLTSTQATLIDRHAEERQLAHDTVLNSERRYYEILNFAVDGILIGERDGTITDANECMCVLFGLKREEIVGKHVADMPFASGEFDRVPLQFKEILAGQTVMVERHIRRADGTEVVVEMHSKMLSGGLLQTIYHDITERKQAQALLENMNQTLEQRVQARTVEVQRYADQLRVLNERLIHAEENERQRISHVLHEDLQQVLVASRMTLEVALASAKEAAVKDVLTRVIGMLTSAIQLTRTLVHGMVFPGIKERHLPDAITFIAHRMKEKFDFEVDVTVGRDVEPVREEVFVFFYRALQEILFNIVKHAQVMHASVLVEPADDHFVRVTVQDGGVGFSFDDLESASSECGNGSDGIGLFGIRQYLEGLGGGLEINSGEGQGAVVVLVLPTCSEV